MSARTNQDASVGSPEKVDVLIVGAGFSGLCMAIKLRQAGLHSFLVIEKGTDIGGTWHENRYPGCACDIPSHLYCFSFDLNSEWNRMYAPQPEIWAYLKSCAERYGLMPQIRLRTPMREAIWDEASSVWHVVAGDGIRIDARVLVSAIGALHVPSIPHLPGIERFAGTAFHSANWDAHAELAGKNVAVIGTGASAIQFVPQIAPLAAKLYVFQRTPAWIVPKPDTEFSEKWKRRFRRVPGVMWAFRKLLFWQHEIRVLAFLGNKRMRSTLESIALRNLRKRIKDPKLREALTPKYALGCKRVLFSNDFYPALARDNVELVTERVAEIREHSIVTQDGVERPLDVLIYGTGFRVTEPMIGIRLVGRAGVEIHDAWRERMSAFLGVTVTGFPNFFILLGPNTGLGHNSVVLMIEAQVRYVISCLKLMRERGQQVMHVRKETQQNFVERVTRRMGRTVWQTGGCRSWYQDQKTGENVTLWPGSVVDYMRRTRSVSAKHYD
ncbi:MAG TPA: NAD(P)/FAD-dependent oxidoreductase [Candidatus Acidoferrales bacterium]|nr:NAD(P)/FAD-dependent oxidoreductase [Candidatus Acidoferrales bacterium]